jgi:cytochrome b
MTQREKDQVDAGEARNGRVEAAGRPVAVWDLPTRVFHWALVALVCAGWITGKLGRLDVHMKIGEAILALVLFRIAWGLVGSRYSRFGRFLVGPRKAIDHARQLCAEARRGAAAARLSAQVGHTALGGWMVVAMLLALAVQTGTGLFASDEIVTDGPLNHLVGSATAHWLDRIHSIGGWLIPTLVAIHVAAALFYLLRVRENLILPLITGRKRVPADATGIEFPFVNSSLALGLLVLAAAIVWAIISI